ncbi:MAG: SDR family NAD(P)-dependent oxidoreductase [Anaerolineaceae bacterium]|nr:SDR family NAD(P)-dependent oxidoreductase [Anaerolineaceae bacterium]
MCKQTVVITGASSGIGRATALHLDQLGFTVFAGVRKEADGISLKSEASSNLEYLLLDVTDGDAVQIAVDTVVRHTDGRLHGLVNNAGISLNAPLELMPNTKIQQIIDVNVVGLLSVTKAFIPLLRRTKGRIINISSGHGVLAVPDKSVYAASKFAVQAITDSLRLELHPFDIQVSSVVVGKVDTAVLGKILSDREQIIETSPSEVVKLYQPLFDFFDGEVKELSGIPPSEVASLISEALTTGKPKSQYLIGPGASKMRNLARLPVGLRDWLMVKALYK